MTPEKGAGVGQVETRTVELAPPPDDLTLASGRRLGPLTLAYETYGRLNQAGDNAVLICHALSGDAHAAGRHKGARKPGWWDAMIGPGRAFDTDRHFVVCSNVIGGCMGSTGPSSANPATGRPWGTTFPLITVADMVEAQARLIDSLGIGRLRCVAGGSMGGMQALQWVAAHPERVASAIPIATALKHTAQQIAFGEVGRQAVMADPAWRDGDYYGHGQPERGLAVARMIGHISYMSEQSMEEKFARRTKGDALRFTFAEEFQVEGYLRYQGDAFVKRFDANSYLYISRAMDYFDLSTSLAPAGTRLATRFLVMAFSSDWLYPPAMSREIVKQLKMRRADVTYVEIDSSFGHDAFLVEFAEQTHLIRHFLERVAGREGNGHA